MRIDAFFFFNDTATTEIYTLSLHDALPISMARGCRARRSSRASAAPGSRRPSRLTCPRRRSEEHTSELQSQSNLVCRLLLEKKNYRDRGIIDCGLYSCASDASCEILRVSLT